MAYTFSRTVKIGKKLKNKRTPWKPRDLRDINLYSTKSKARELRKADLMRHSRYSENGTETIEVRDKQSDPSDISTYQINQQKDGSSANFYEGSTGNDILEGGNGDDYLKDLKATMCSRGIQATTSSMAAKAWTHSPEEREETIFASLVTQSLRHPTCNRMIGLPISTVIKETRLSLN